ncbi:transposable element Tcb1 transposase [Trichonephila clavipes]|nr:transposable element Tcb1 transposase [Trichonephila clavipes]
MIFLSRNRSSCVVEQFHSDASLEAVDRKASHNSKYRQWTTEDESRFNLWDHHGRIRFRCYAGERCLPEYVIERHSGLTSGVKPADSPDMSPIEHVWDLVGRRLARDTRPAASKDDLWFHIQEIWNYFPQEDIQNLFDSLPRRIAALIAARGIYTKY